MIRAAFVSLAFFALALPMTSTAAPKASKVTGQEAAAQNGYEVAIDGMTCASCAESVTKALQALPGVEKGAVTVVLKEKKAFVSMAKQDVTLETQIKKAVTDAGYKVASLNWTKLALQSSTANAEEAKGIACKDCGKEGHTCEHCGAKGQKHTCSEGESCKGDCDACKKAGHHHGKDHKHDDKKTDEHAGH